MYGGTKEEMQRLLADATKLSGIQYSIGNFSDIIEAIHVVQTELGITGTTAEEASSTIEGSFNAMKSAWSNMLTAFADDNADFDTVVGNLVTSITTFGNNIIPRIKTTLDGIGIFLQEFAWQIPNIIIEIIPSVIDSAIEVVGALVDSLINSSPMLIDSAVNIIKTLANGIQSNLPTIVTSAMDILNSLVNAMVDILPMLLEVGLQAIITLGQGIAQNLPTLIPTLVNLIISMCDMIIENLPMIIDVAIDIILALVQGIINALPMLIENVPRIINSFADGIYNSLPKILAAAVQIIVMLVKGLIDSIPLIIENLPQIIMAIINAFTLVNWWQIGTNLIASIGKGIASMVSNIGTIAKFTGESVVNGIKGIFSSGGSIGRNLISWVANGISSSVVNLIQAAKNVAILALQGLQNILGWDSAASIGRNLIQGIWNGISNMSGWILNKIGGFASSVISGIKGFFGIHSPSRIMRDLIGTNIVKGIGVGIDVETPNLERDIDANMSDLIAKMQGTVDYETSMTTAKVVAHNNTLGGGTDEGKDKTQKQVVENHIHVDIEGREVAYAIAPHQDILNEYQEGR